MSNNRNENFDLLAEQLKNLHKAYNDAINELISSAALHEKDKIKTTDSLHEVVSRKVFRRLLLRYSQLGMLTELIRDQFEKFSVEKNKSFKITDNDEKKAKSENPELQNIELYMYKHVITDLFVEKALAYLEEAAHDYQSKGNLAYKAGLSIIILAIIFASLQYFNVIHNSEAVVSWLDFTYRFTRSFTFYGLMVLAAVGLWRYSRATLDQGERLLERRHALRQGRLFVHLHDSKVSIEDMEKAFNWNVSQPNAFSAMSTDAKAPWGMVANEAIKSTADLAKAVKSISEIKSKETENS